MLQVTKTPEGFRLTATVQDLHDWYFYDLKFYARPLMYSDTIADVYVSDLPRFKHDYVACTWDPWEEALAHEGCYSLAQDFATDNLECNYTEGALEISITIPRETPCSAK